MKKLIYKSPSFSVPALKGTGQATYEVKVFSNFEVDLALVGASDNLDRRLHSPFDDFEPVRLSARGDHDIGVNPFSVFRKAEGYIAQWVAKDSPPYFFLKSTTKRKVALYKRLAKRSKLSYNVYVLGKEIYFYRSQ